MDLNLFHFAFLVTSFGTSHTKTPEGIVGQLTSKHECWGCQWHLCLFTVPYGCALTLVMLLKKPGLEL